MSQINYLQIQELKKFQKLTHNHVSFLILLFVFFGLVGCRNDDNLLLQYGKNNHNIDFKIKASSYLGVKVQEINFYDKKNEYVTYHIMEKINVDAAFKEVMKEFENRQSCSTLSDRDGLILFNFYDEYNYYFIASCTECSDFMNNVDCHNFKKELMNYLLDRNIQRLDW